MPSDKSWVWVRDEAVRIKMGEKGPAAEKPISVPTLFQTIVKSHPQAIAMAAKRGTDWKKWTYQQYYDDVVTAAKALIVLGVQPFHGVGVIGFNCPEWFISAVGAIFSG